MKPIERMMVATDFTACADGAAAVAARLAQQLHASIDVVTVIDTSEPADAFTDPAFREQRIVRRYAEAWQRAKVFGDRHFGHIDHVNAYVRDSDDIVGEIILAAENLQSDLIVLGTYGATGLDHMLLGSYAERIVRTSPIPVVTVRGPA